jgi:putative membrane protein
MPDSLRTTSAVPVSYRYELILLVLWAGGLAWSAVRPHDYFTWFLEVVPALVGVSVLAVTITRFRFTPLTYGVILLHCWVLFIGGHYTYAEVPAFDWLRDTFHQTRNNYDKVGHFMQGFGPALIAREVYLRRKVVQGSGWLAFLAVCTCMAISALYELIEWAVAAATGEGADAFLGTQGYAWDTQSDMLWATIGAVVAVIAFSRLQDWQIRRSR